MKAPERIPGKRLVLRRHRMTDAGPFAAFLAHPTATRYMAFTPEQKSREGAREMLEYVITSYDTDEPVVSLTIADPETDQYLGSCGLQPLAAGEGVEIYYTVLPEHQNRGLGTEATRALIDFVLDTTATDRIVAFVVPENVASVRVAEKLGFIDDGPVERRATTGEMAHGSLAGRRYVLTRDNARGRRGSGTPRPRREVPPGGGSHGEGS